MLCIRLLLEHQTALTFAYIVWVLIAALTVMNVMLVMVMICLASFNLALGLILFLLPISV